MGKLQEFDITFKDNKVVYSPGESLSGTLKITTTEALLCKDIKVNCQGFCGVTSKSNDTAWMVEEQYFSSTLSVADKGTLKPGDHSFPFKFLIPDINYEITHMDSCSNQKSAKQKKIYIFSSSK
ncbi:unnamed protein product [Oncorhynchus mykiss]|uniref:Arrestin-like N-terminal domain-containing protein n=1 Tax=Oncorhynchus mykiss TaxID=8022 RepID=A0A060YJ37_ONCMY|nr:unnamed protein product [Oncorhynchus mykiss]